MCTEIAYILESWELCMCEAVIAAVVHIMVYILRLMPPRLVDTGGTGSLQKKVADQRAYAYVIVGRLTHVWGTLTRPIYGDPRTTHVFGSSGC